MKARNVFGIIVRTIGLLLAIHALGNFQTLVVMSDGLDRAGFSRGAFFFGFLIELFLGLGLLFHARAVLRLAYRRPMKRPEPAVRSTRQSRRALATGRRQPQTPDFDNLGDDELIADESIPEELIADEPTTAARENWPSG